MSIAAHIILIPANRVKYGLALPHTVTKTTSAFKICLSRPPSGEIMHDLDFWHVGRPWPWLGWDCRSRLYVKGQGQMPKIVFWFHCYPALRSKSKVGVKVTGQGQRSRSNLWGSAFPSATKNQKLLSVRGVCLCVDLSCGCGRSVFNALLSGSFINWVTRHKMGQGITLKFSNLFHKNASFYITFSTGDVSIRNVWNIRSQTCTRILSISLKVTVYNCSLAKDTADIFLQYAKEGFVDFHQVKINISLADQCRNLTLVYLEAIILRNYIHV